MKKSELENATSYIQKHFSYLPKNESVIEWYSGDLTYSGGISHGNLYFTRSFFCFVGVGKKKSVKSKIFSASDILNLYREGDSILFITNKNRKYNFTNFVFVDIAKVDKIFKKFLFGITGDRAIHDATKKRDYERVCAILEIDYTELNHFNNEEKNALGIAITMSNIKLVHIILDYYREYHELDINSTDDQQNFSVLHLACYMRNVNAEILSDLLSIPSINVNITNKDMNTPLHYFCERNTSSKILTNILTLGGDVNLPNSQGELCLHKLMFNQSPFIGKIAHKLIEAGADINHQSYEMKETPLHYAVRTYNLDLVRVLMSLHANFQIENKDGQTPQQLAENLLLNPHLKASNLTDIVWFFEDCSYVADLLLGFGRDDILYVLIEQELISPETLLQIDSELLSAPPIEMKSGNIIKLMTTLEGAKEEIKNRKESRIKQKKSHTTEKSISEYLDCLPTVISEDQANIILEKLDISLIEFEDLKFVGEISKKSSYHKLKAKYLGETVAVKILTCKEQEDVILAELRKFYKEIEILSKIDSTRVLKFFGLVVNPFCIISEYCENSDLLSLLKEAPDYFTWDVTISSLMDITSALQDLHSQHIIHRWVSANHFFLSGKKLKICGLKYLRSDTETNLDTLQQVTGTAQYAAPEKLTGTLSSKKSDIYSLGIVIWEILNVALTRKYSIPFSEFNLEFDFQIMIKVESGTRPTLPENCPPLLLELYRSCVLKIPEERPDCIQILEKLEDIKMEYTNVMAIEDPTIPNPYISDKKSDQNLNIEEDIFKSGTGGTKVRRKTEQAKSLLKKMEGDKASNKRNSYNANEVRPHTSLSVNDLTAKVSDPPRRKNSKSSRQTESTRKKLTTKTKTTKTKSPSARNQNKEEPNPLSRSYTKR